ncbi:cellular tumor antigen P53, putative [Schistosoma mansoni]|uniref:cellular tumor antigen P53, putative n=1 Tax=Schistosoma mansoni TaxID=6183 RepID=UPI0001A63312|nr:cellular tumor antigen P53, putative [Schistosoma mansoni]|eukprot:XP_018646355.1 cellular tumor antigen P53, putative [Schistosoma mansoni]
MYGTQHRFKISPNTYHDLENGNSLTTTSIGPRPDTDLDSAFPPKKLYTDDIPVLFLFHHKLYFKDEQGWTNLYAKKTPTWWTLSYWCQRKPPEGSFIRLTPVYGASDKQQEVIQRCFEDFMAIPTSGMGRYSIVMVGNSLAEYFFDPITERLCVTLPYETPKEGCEYSQFNGKFMCFNSCLYNGGQGNKKPLFLIITLERLITGSDPSKGHCEVLGRQCIKFRSCACPKRDKENNERRTGDSLVIGTPSLSKRRKESSKRERINLLNMYQQTYHFSGDSTDSQPNSTLSTGAMGFNGTGNLDEPVNILNQDYFNSSNMNGSVGSDLMNSNLPRNLSNHQTNIMQNMAAYILSSTSTNTTTSTTTTATSINNIGNRGFIYNTPNAVDTNWSYETDSDLRSGQTSHTDQLYESNHQGLIIGNNNNNSTLHVVSELIDPYALVQHLPQSLSSSSPVHQHHHIHSHHLHSAHVQSQHNHQIHLHQGMNNSTSISDTNDNHSSAFTTTALISDNTMNNKSLTLNTCLLPQITPTTTATVTDTGTIGTTNFGHDFNTSNFYTSAYFNLTNSNTNADNNSNGSNNNVMDCTNVNQSNDITDQNSTLIDSLSRSSIPSNLNHRSISQNSTLCNYQLTNHTNLSESLLLSEELLHNCLDNKKKCYDEPDGVHSILTKHLRNTSFCLSSTRSPESCGAEKFVKLEI